jgi:hypothetical protein
MNPKLYAIVKAEADKRFLAHTSAYKSGWIVKTYKDRGGKYMPNESGSHPNNKTGLRRWFAEEWVNLMAPKPNTPCGRSHASNKGVYPVCRPKIRVNKSTPITVDELSKQRIKTAERKKQQVKDKGSIRF